MAQLSEWVSVSEAVRLSGLSTRTLKRMAEEGRIKFRHSPGGHIRVARADLDGLLRQSAKVPGQASSILQQKKERVEELVLESQALRAEAEMDRLLRDQADRECQRAEARRAEAATRELALAEQRSRQASELERRKSEQRQAKTERQQVEFECRCFRLAKDRLSILNWLSAEQRHTVMEEVSFEVRAHGPADADAMEEILTETIARVVTPWQAAREARARREKLLEQSLWTLTWATEQERLRVAADARAAIAALPLTATDLEIRSTLSAVISPIAQAVRERIAQERAENLREQIQALGALAKLVWPK